MLEIISPLFSQRRIHSKEISLIEESKGNLKETKKFPLWGLLGEIILIVGPIFLTLIYHMSLPTHLMKKKKKKVVAGLRKAAILSFCDVI